MLSLKSLNTEQVQLEIFASNGVKSTRFETGIEKQLNVLPFIIFAIIFFNATSVVIVFCHETRRLKDTALSFVHFNNASVGEEIGLTKYIIYWAFEFGIGVPVLVIPFLINWIDDQIDERFKSNQKRFH